jgi:hypothetical protein
VANDRKPDAVHSAEDKIDRATAGSDKTKNKNAQRPDERADVDALEAEQRRESGEAWAGPGVPASTDGQWKGLIIGSLVGGAIGLLVLLPLAFIPIGGLSLVGRLLICGIAGALAGGTAGAMYLGGRMPELQGETVDADGRPSVGSTPRDPRSDDRGR